ncbi:hypothetical protein ACFL3Y_02545 [Pseudomonadota bacterium]
MKLAHWIATLVLALASATSLAARPTSIVFESNAETADGKLYGQYTVNCNDGRAVVLTAWDGNSRWCLGAAGSSDCQKKQISAARSACEPSNLGQSELDPQPLPLAVYSR